MTVRAWLGRRSPRQILAVAALIFLVYAFPGFLSNDQESNILDARSGIYEDAHPPILPLLWRLCSVVMTGPLPMLLVQTAMILAGLYLLLRQRLSPQRAAVVASAILIFPPVAGVIAIAGGKEPLMFGFTLLGIALVMSERTWPRRAGVALLVLGTAVRWNALAATCVPVVLLYATRRTGWRRYAISFAMWIAITVAAFGLNRLLTDRPTHLWFGTHAYQDIAGTLRWLPDRDDASLRATFAGTPLVRTDGIHAWLKANYNPGHYSHLNYGDDRVWDRPATAAERDAVWRAWKEIVLGNPAAYLQYRWDNFKLLLSLDRTDAFSNVYVWFTMIAEPDVPARIQHDATASRVQDLMRDGNVELSNTPLFWVFPYAFACVLLLPFARRDRLAAAFLLSAIGYELAWFFLAPTTDLRYSAWLLPCLVLAAASLARRFAKQTIAPSTVVVTIHCE
ncbi:MAG: hypothetical protein ABI867_24270 [Kofleriaceae bacterium]